jgi:ATP-binding cassette subfamily B protein/ATP-binding cassette subfamily C protein
MLDLLKKTDLFFTKKDKLYFFFLLVLSLLVSVVEIVGISLLIPFIALAANPLMIDTNQYLKWVYQFFPFDNKNEFIVALGVTIVLFYFLRGGINSLFLYLPNKFAWKKHHYIKEQLFRNYIQLYYQDFVKENTGVLTKNLMQEVSYVTQGIIPVLVIISEVFILVLLYALLLLTDWKVTMATSITMGILVIVISKLIKKSIAESGDLKSFLTGELNKKINEAFGNFKIIKMTGSEDLTVFQFGRISKKLTFVLAHYMFILGVPKIFLETLGIVVIIAIATYVSYSYEDSSLVLPVLSMFALAFYRMLPSINKILSGVNQIRFFKPSLDIVYGELSKKSESLGTREITFQKAIELERVTFGFQPGRNVLNRISIKIPKGQKVAYIGESGSGKSTLVNLIMGMYQPDTGDIRIDGQLLTEELIKSWRRKIGYIPQSIYLFDGTVAENVIFYRKPDKEKLIQSFKKANIYDFLQTKEGVDTKVGDGGIQLSGGQKQRIAIARALYGDPDILILDEATSALDDETEKKIMEEIYQVSAGKTLLVIAHRLSTLRKCEVMYRLNQGNIRLVESIA